MSLFVPVHPSGKFSVLSFSNPLSLLPSPSLFPLPFRLHICKPESTVCDPSPPLPLLSEHHQTVRRPLTLLSGCPAATLRDGVGSDDRQASGKLARAPPLLPDDPLPPPPPPRRRRRAEPPPTARRRGLLPTPPPLPHATGPQRWNYCRRAHLMCLKGGGR